MSLQKDPHIAICYFGEGATSEGDFHVALNFAAVRKAPCLFFCRNNGYAISTSVERQFASKGIAPKGEGYGVETHRIDGNDFFAVFEAVKIAKAYALAGKGPVLIEAMTYRMAAHSTSDDPSRYRQDQEVAKWGLKCPLIRLRRYLENEHLWNPQEEKVWMEQVNSQVDEGIEKARQTPKPPLHSLIENVYFETPANLKEQLEEVNNYVRNEHHSSA
jgi:pyruvate dehydrogenase E1 component alpha subunit